MDTAVLVHFQDDEEDKGRLHTREAVKKGEKGRTYFPPSLFSYRALYNLLDEEKKDPAHGDRRARVTDKARPGDSLEQEPHADAA